MDDNYTLRIDPNTHDLTLDADGIMETIAGDASSAQAVRLTLEVYKGELMFDPSHGTDYGRIMGRRVSSLEEDEIGEIVREAVFQEGDVEQIDAVRADFDRHNLKVAFAGRLRSGMAITTEVVQDG